MFSTFKIPLFPFPATPNIFSFHSQVAQTHPSRDIVKQLLANFSIVVKKSFWEKKILSFIFSEKFISRVASARPRWTFFHFIVMTLRRTQVEIVVKHTILGTIQNYYKDALLDKTHFLLFNLYYNAAKPFFWSHYISTWALLTLLSSTFHTYILRGFYKVNSVVFHDFKVLLGQFHT